jgi:outer membrane protein assembly factor BamB
VANGVVYTGSTNGDLYALNAATGSVRWTYPIGTGLVSPPSVANGVVYIGANSQETVYALNAASGKKLWSYNLSSAGPGETVKSSPAIADGVLYVNAGNVYAFDLK